MFLAYSVSHIICEALHITAWKILLLLDTDFGFITSTTILTHTKRLKNSQNTFGYCDTQNAMTSILHTPLQASSSQFSIWMLSEAFFPMAVFCVCQVSGKLSELSSNELISNKSDISRKYKSLAPYAHNKNFRLDLQLNW